MRLNLLVFFVILILPLSALAEQQVTMGWEGTGTVLHVYGNGIATIETSAPVHSGGQSLKFQEDPLQGTPQAYLAWVRDLSDGDTVTASFWVYDDTPAASPSGRIWGHWNDSADPQDVSAYSGSAGGRSDYSAGTGWSLLEWEWTVKDGHTGLMIVTRIYSSLPDKNILWIDDLTIAAPDNATFVLPDNETTLGRCSWAGVKTSF